MRDEPNILGATDPGRAYVGLNNACALFNLNNAVGDEKLKVRSIAAAAYSDRRKLCQSIEAVRRGNVTEGWTPPKKDSFNALLSTVCSNGPDSAQHA
jgi:hypothetical protein